jgi:transglutaminase-like putative cysteine protease
LNDATSSGVLRDVGCELVFDITEPSLLALQIAPASTSGAIVEERLEITDGSGAAVVPSAEVAAEHGARIHLVPAARGILSINYVAALRAGSAPVFAPGPDRDGETASLAAIVALRQSRYCPSDALAGFATTEFADVIGDTPGAIALRVASWVFERLAYVPGSSGPLDTAVDTLIAGSGVCRDFAHLTITLCRALGVPARLAAVYAPGLAPMDFHAVVEILTPAGWQVLDPTRLAPRSALVRIATGRDAADTAFATTLHGTAELITSLVFASSEGDLPADDHARPLPLA